MSERQMVTSIRDVEFSHKARYFFASAYIKKGDRVLDACCGVGYGTRLMQDFTHAEEIDCFDQSLAAVNIAEESFGVEPWRESFENMILTDNYYNVITCFEAIEHVTQPELLISKLCQALKPGGKLILSTPNERRMPWSAEKFPEHIRHFTAEQIYFMMRANGIENVIPYAQEKFSPTITLGEQGRYLIFVGVKS